MKKLNLKRKNYFVNFLNIKENSLVLFKYPEIKVIDNKIVSEITLHNGRRVLLSFSMIEKIISNCEENTFYLLVFTEKKGKKNKYWLPELFETGLTEINEDDLNEIAENFPDFEILE